MTPALLKKTIIIIYIAILSLPHLLYADTAGKNALHGQGWAYADKNEFLAFPEYCRARFYPDKSSFHQKWKKRIGRDFIHLHHY